MTVSNFSAIEWLETLGVMLLPWFETLGEIKLGYDGAPEVFAKALSDVNPNIFTKELQKFSEYLFDIFHEELEISVSEARLISEGFEEVARSEYKRLRMASGVATTGTA